MDENKWKDKVNDHELREDFCGACLAAPIAIAGSGVILYNSKNNNSRKTYKLQKKISIWVGVIMIVISLAIACYYLKSCDKCK
jgi:hypothetical protein